MREFVKHIAASLREDDHWQYDAHWAFSKKLETKVWTANGYFFLHFQIYGDSKFGYRDVHLSLVEKAVIWWAVRRNKRAHKRRADEALLESIISRRLNAKESS